jgi:hypothetical protein
MPDDVQVLRGAVTGYRAAVTAAGVPWLDEDAGQTGCPSIRFCRVFDVDRIAEQPICSTSRHAVWAGSAPQRVSADVGQCRRVARLPMSRFRPYDSDPMERSVPSPAGRTGIHRHC